MSGGMGINAPNPHTPLPLEPMSGSAPYLASQTAVRGGLASDPFKDSLRLMMFIWGAVLLASFVTPVATEPKLGFHWDLVASDAPLALKLPSMLIAAVGLLGIVLALIPMVSLPRGLLAALLGLAAIFVPMAVGSFPKWIVLVDLIGSLTLVAGLLLRNEYTDSLVARILVTLGVICVLVPMLVPEHGGIPLVGLFKALIHLPGKQKVIPVLQLGMVVIAVMCLLAWIPGPATGGAKVLAWLAILWPTALTALVTLLVGGDIGDHVKESPYESLMAWSAPASYIVLIGYGVATVIGKQLE